MAKEIRADGRRIGRKRKFQCVVQFTRRRALTERFFLVWAVMFRDAVTELELFDDDVKELERDGWRIQEIGVYHPPKSKRSNLSDPKS